LDAVIVDAKVALNTTYKFQSPEMDFFMICKIKYEKFFICGNIFWNLPDTLVRKMIYYLRILKALASDDNNG
jgi:hypothetical protein